MVPDKGVVMTEITLSFREDALYSVSAAKDAGYCSGAQMWRNHRSSFGPFIILTIERLMKVTQKIKQYFS